MSDEIRAAQIAAQAAVQAAWIQGLLTLAAGLIAVMGGFFAYAAAGRAVRLEESRYTARVAAYRTRMTEVAVKLSNVVLLNSLHLKDDPDTIRIETFTIPEELNPSNWRDHAMLGNQAVTAISDLYEIAKLFDRFAQEMRGKPASAQSEQFGGPIGSDEFTTEYGIGTYRHINQSLANRTEKLRVALRV